MFPEETAGIVKETEMETVGRCGHVVTTSMGLVLLKGV